MIVDEAQDLTPMQLRMVARRAAGSFTLLGDIAQATGPFPTTAGRSCCRTWKAPRARRSRSSATPTACRARSWSSPSRCWRRIAPEVEPPVAYRVGAEPPRLVEADPPLAAAYEEAARLPGEEGLLAVIAPASLRGEGRGARSSTSRASPCSPRVRRRAWSSTT